MSRFNYLVPLSWQAATARVENHGVVNDQGTRWLDLGHLGQSVTFPEAFTCGGSWVGVPPAPHIKVEDPLLVDRLFEGAHQKGRFVLRRYFRKSGETRAVLPQIEAQKEDSVRQPNCFMVRVEDNQVLTVDWARGPVLILPRSWVGGWGHRFATPDLGHILTSRREGGTLNATLSVVRAC